MQKINKDIREAFTLSGNFYSCEEIFKTSLEKIFVRSWHLISDINILCENKRAIPFYLMNNTISEPLFLINNNNNIQCFSNVCTHRGNILIDKPKIIKDKIVCRYHGKSFDTCGKFNFMPKSDGMKNFPSSQDDLCEVPCFKWRQFIFTSLEPAFSLDELVKEMNERIGWMPIEDFIYRKDLSKEYTVNANWALYCDNYLEGFHIPFIHKDLNTVLDANNYDVETFNYSNLQIGIGKGDDECFNIPKSSKDYGKNIAAYYFWLFPNLMFNFYPWGLSVNIVKPVSEKKTKIEFRSYVWDEKKLDYGAGADLDKVEMEDEEVVENVQKGVSSRFYKHGRFSPSMEQGVHHFHRLVSRFMLEN